MTTLADDIQRVGWLRGYQISVLDYLSRGKSVAQTAKGIDIKEALVLQKREEIFCIFGFDLYFMGLEECTKRAVELYRAYGLTLDLPGRESSAKMRGRVGWDGISGRDRGNTRDVRRHETRVAPETIDISSVKKNFLQLRASFRRDAIAFAKGLDVRDISACNKRKMSSVGNSLSTAMNKLGIIGVDPENRRRILQEVTRDAA